MRENWMNLENNLLRIIFFDIHQQLIECHHLIEVRHRNL